MADFRPDPDAGLDASLREFAVSTAEGASPSLYEPLTRLLSSIRQHLRMDVVFISRFVDQQRVFQVVSTAGERPPGLSPGDSDPLLDTYCQRIVDGRLPRVIADTADSPEARSLPVTRKLGIGAYLSAPVVLPNGVVFGTVCCISHSPRPDLVDADARALAAVADSVAAAIDRKGRIDFKGWM